MIYDPKKKSAKVFKKAFVKGDIRSCNISTPSKKVFLGPFLHFKRYAHDVYMFLNLQNISDKSVEMDFRFGAFKKCFSGLKWPHGTEFHKDGRIFYMCSTLHFVKIDKNDFLLP